MKMKNKNLSSLIPHLNICISTILFLFQTTSSVDPLHSACEPKKCGNLTIKYPFYIEGQQNPSCGFPGFNISCHENIPILRAPDNTFQIQEIDYRGRYVHLLDTAIVNLQNGCFPKLNNMSLQWDVFAIYTSDLWDLYLFSNCLSYPTNLTEHKIGCEGENEHGNETGFAMFRGQGNLSYVRSICKRMVFTEVKVKDGILDYFRALKGGIFATWPNISLSGELAQNCQETGGEVRLGYGGEVRLGYCACPPGTFWHKFANGWHEGHGCKADDAKWIYKRSTFIGLSATVALVLIIGGGGCLSKTVRKKINKKKRHKFFKKNGGLLLERHMSSSDGNVDKTKVFNSFEIEKATDHFNVNRVLGQGGQGTVYKGILSDGRIVAVKKSIISDTTNVEQFINEVVILSQINQRNIVKLMGCCLETEVPLLVYEFIANGTLYQHIHNPDEEFPLTWEIRLRIAKEVAGALSYMHSAASMPIYHRDIKSTNILLDDKYKARVCDFGTSRSVDIDKTHFTTRVQGTFGYLDPEYFRSSQFTEKSDVYSFGVVLVELLTGFKPIFSSESQEIRGLAAYFLQAMEEDRFIEMIDSRIFNENKIEEIVMVAHLAEKCLHLNGRHRPTMKDIACRLEGVGMSKEENMPEENYGDFTSHGIDIIEGDDDYSSSPETTNPSLVVFPLVESH